MTFIPPDGVEFREGQPKGATVSGVPYVTFFTRAIRPEGGPTPQPRGEATEEAAWAVFNSALEKYLRDERATVVEWRIPPTVDGAGELNAPDFYGIRARLAVVKRAA